VAPTFPRHSGARSLWHRGVQANITSQTDKTSHGKFFSSYLTKAQSPVLRSSHTSNCPEHNLTIIQNTRGFCVRIGSKQIDLFPSWQVITCMLLMHNASFTSFHESCFDTNSAMSAADKWITVTPGIALADSLNHWGKDRIIIKFGVRGWVALGLDTVFPMTLYTVGNLNVWTRQ